MSKTEYIFHTDSLYREFRERSMKFGLDLPSVIQGGIGIHKVDFISNNSGCLLPEDQKEVENVQFPYILFLPEGTKQFDEILIILNGLNESEYRKFFPWAVSFAMSGIPTIIFPIAFLINRRPKRWFIPKDLDKKLEIRRNMDENSACTLYNVVLSQRLERNPERFFLSGLETYRDLSDLGNLINSGEYHVAQGDKTFIKDTKIHFLGYSLGGYLALIFLMGKKDEPIFSQTKLIVFCSGAAINNDEPDLNANPISPLILDKNASERLISFYRSGEKFPFMDTEEASLFKAVFLSERSTLDPELNRLKKRIKIMGSEKDKVIPLEGIERNLGWVDEDLKLGIHEYPFSVKSLERANLERQMSRSYNVSEEFQGVFRRFVDSVISAIRD
jgi:uncharacterized protein DUF6051